MKGRSQRLPSTDQPEDWVDGSWTVDCICGVNFDDGEEMVNCDECGVWVHTRCSRYVKGEESFACDKCKSKNSRNNSEETEVAQLLVELPTKTVTMEASYAANGPTRRPFRLWTEMPLEERVHVQGIPGGDPGLFSELSSVFTPQLWKCTGYVPKKFNFQYREFPCWGDPKEADANVEEDNENAIDKGAGVLFSLSKESVLPTPVKGLVGMRSRDQECKLDGKYDGKSNLRQTSKWGGGDIDFRHSQNAAKKERSLLRPVVVHSGKRKKEESGILKEISAKKKARIAEKDVDSKKRALHSSKTVFTPTSDAKQLEFCEDRGQKSFKTDIQGVKNRNLRDGVPVEPVSDGHFAVQSIVTNGKNNLAAVDLPLEALSAELSSHDNAVLSRDEAGNHMLSGASTISKIAPFDEQHDEAGSPSMMKVGGSGTNNHDGSSVCSISKHSGEDVGDAAPETTGKQILSVTNSDRTIELLQHNVKKEVEDGNAKDLLQIQSSTLAEVKSVDMPSRDAKCPEISCSQTSENIKVNEVEVNSSIAAAAITDCLINNGNELSCDAQELKQEVEGSDDSRERQTTTSESKPAFGSPVEPSNSSGPELPVASITEQKLVVSMEKSSSVPSSVLILKPSRSDKLKTPDSQLHPSAKQRIADCGPSSKKEQVVADVFTENGGHNLPRKTAKDCPTSSSGTSLKVSHPSKAIQASVSKRVASDSKDLTFTSSSKSPSSHNPSISSGSGDSLGQLQNHSTAHVQNKVTVSGLPQKSGKFNQTNFPSSKANQTAPGHSPSIPSSSPTLSDEELALLLHQELNSSPRVPRVPRVRHAGSFPQLASQAATSMLIKRTSSSGTKDHNMVPRRKGKEGSKDVVRGSRERDDEAKKTDRLASLDQRRQDPVQKGDASRREANRSTASLHHFKKNTPALTTSTSSGPSSSTEANDNKVSSTHSAAMNNSDDDTGAVGGPVHQTLPGLINEIMSKGRRMTYEELCNAVLPHWNNLRKHNGERYAYSSHSQAVLDCLRNRQEWAQLVDRGPKTSTSKKRRKTDADDSEDNEDGAHAGKEVESRSLESQREEFPKGKRNARKRRRRLALQGRGVKDLRSRQKADMRMEDDIDYDGTLSNSSEESIFSEEEIQGGGGGPVGSEDSSSSGEVRNMRL